MKTNTSTEILGLIAVVAVAVALAVWAGAQTAVAAAKVNAEAAASQAPALTLIGGQLAGWALNTILGIVAVALASGLVVWAKGAWKGRQEGKKWKSGPNAQWQGQERGPRAASSDELMRMMLMQQMMTNGRGKAMTQAPVNDDEFPVEF